MKQTTHQAVQRLYLLLTFGNTLAASLIWGINTLFLLDAGLNNFEAFAANAFFTLGMVIFEVPTGVIADTMGRLMSFLLGTITLSATTWLYFLLWEFHAPFWEWAVVSLLLGLGFTFFSGAVEAWLVDALAATNYPGELETVFGRGQMATGAAMLIGSVSGGIIAQYTSLGIPFLIRAGILALIFALAFFFMKDLGFSPDRNTGPVKAVKRILRASVDNGFRNPPVKWLMLAAPFAGGVGIYVFYAAQPFLLQLYGDSHAYTVAGLVAAIIACAQITGGYLAPKIRALPYRPVTLMVTGTVISASTLLLLGMISHFVAALLLIVVWGLVFAALMPIRQSYINKLIPSAQRATVLSFDSLMSSAGSVVSQPLLGRAADVWSYGTSFAISGMIQIVAAPLIARSQDVKVVHTGKGKLR